MLVCTYIEGVDIVYAGQLYGKAQIAILLIN